MIDERDGYTPTPVVSHAILTYNKNRKSGLADGIVITPSHNPPEDGGFKYNPPNGGPADFRPLRGFRLASTTSLWALVGGCHRAPAATSRYRAFAARILRLKAPTA